MVSRYFVGKSIANCKSFLLITALVVLGQVSAFATAYTWLSTTAGGPWVTNTNWTGSVLPVSAAANTVSFAPTTTITINNTAPSTPFTLGTFTAGGTGTTALSLSTACTWNITTLTCTGNFTIGGGAGAQTFNVTGGSVASGKTLTVSLSSSMTISGTFTVTGTLANSGTITVASGGVLIFAGTTVAIPSNITVASGGEIRCTGGGNITGLGGTSPISGTVTLAGTTTTASGFLGQWQSGSTLKYAGTSAQTANY